MGTDFLQKVGKTLKRSWDEGRTRMAAPDLTTRELVGGTRGISAIVVSGATLTPGEAVTLEADGNAVVIRRGQAVIAHNQNPTQGTLQALKRHHNIIPGNVIVVHAISGMVEVMLSC